MSTMQPATPGTPAPPARRSPAVALGCAAAVVAALLLVLSLILLVGHYVDRVVKVPENVAKVTVQGLADLLKPNFSEKTVVLNTVGSLKKESKLVVLTANVTADVHKENTKEWLGVNWGTTTVDLKAPGKVQFYVPLGDFGPQNIQVSGRTVIVTVPTPLPDHDLVEVESDPAKIEVKTDAGWARLKSWSGQALENKAKRELRGYILQAADTPLIHEQAATGARQALTPLLEPLATALQSDAKLEIRFAAPKAPSK
jgi:hypothetical protein